MSTTSKSKIVHQFMDFSVKSPTAFHVAEQAFYMMQRGALTTDHQLKVLYESDAKWDLKPGGLYAIDRNGSSIAFFRMPDVLSSDPISFKIAAAHTDSPAFKLKENPEIFTDGYIRLNIEGYGGMIRSSWFDRPLSVAGRVFVDDDGEIKEELVDLHSTLKVIIPSLAIHMRKPEDEVKKISIQREMLPVIGQYDADSDGQSVLWSLIRDQLYHKDATILSHDLFLYCLDEPHLLGADKDILSACRLDDQACVFASAWAFGKTAPNDGSVSILFLLDNEEVGSASKQGADSSFISEVLERICLALGMDRSQYMASLAKSRLVSADNAHAAHPAYMNRADMVNRPVLNGGIVFKYSANQRYCTDGMSAAFFKKICADNDIDVQVFHNNSDVAGGSTLGNIALSHVSMPAIDIGIAQLAMHSAYECCGAHDLDDMEEFFEAYFGS